MPIVIDEDSDSGYVSVAEREEIAKQAEAAKDPTADVDTGTQSVIGEIGEAFHEISTAFLGLQDAFIGFGTTIGAEAQALGKKMQVSVGNIKNNVGELTNKFKNMGDNLSNTLK